MNFIPALDWSMVSLLSGLGLGWYLRGRGLQGVENDIANIKQDVLHIKNYFSPQVTTSASTPVAV